MNTVQNIQIDCTHYLCVCVALHCRKTVLHTQINLDKVGQQEVSKLFSKVALHFTRLILCFDFILIIISEMFVSDV